MKPLLSIAKSLINAALCIGIWSSICGAVLAETEAGQTDKVRWIHPRCEPLDLQKDGPFICLDDRRIICFDKNSISTSTDDGRNWSPSRPIYEGSEPGVPGRCPVVLKTKRGAIVIAYTDSSSLRRDWNPHADDFGPDARLDVWSIRSLDDGKTWSERQKVFAGFCGALTDMIETADGHIVLPVQTALSNPGRHGQTIYISDDDAKSWKRTQLIDLGGNGHHDGALEPTLVQLRDGRLRMLIRTNWDLFWEAFSHDQGHSWRTIQPSRIHASSAPGCLRRLASGRLVLVWNRLYPEALSTDEQPSYPRISRSPVHGLFSTEPASWQREELSIAFSEDDGQNWSKPVVVVREEESELAYPYLFERRRGELWLITWWNQDFSNDGWHGNWAVRPPVRVRLHEAGFIAEKN